MVRLKLSKVSESLGEVRPATEQYRVALRSGGEYVTRGGNDLATCSYRVPSGLSKWASDPSALFDAAWLRASRRPPIRRTAPSVRVADLFSGCGGMSLGVSEACRALGMRAVPVLANDVDLRALATYGLNFPSAHLLGDPIERVFGNVMGARPTAAERRVRRASGGVDLLLGGPPCQGHSNLNNHTRRDDPKNDLYFRMARAAEVLEPAHVIIENVPTVTLDRGGVVKRTTDALASLGYAISGAVLSAADFGVAQRRRRYFTVATRRSGFDVSAVSGDLSRPPRSVRWAISDLLRQHACADPVLDSPAVPSETNRRRIEHLFEHDLYDLPDEMRPDCHRLKRHSYRAVYGRLSWDESAPTLTTGFGCTGQGRNVHPSRPRTITPHEAARLQFFPDFFQFGDHGRTALQVMIGNAVPPKLAYAIALQLLRK